MFSCLVQKDNVHDYVCTHEAPTNTTRTPLTGTEIPALSVLCYMRDLVAYEVTLTLLI
jgi:hypothetical protein